MFPLIQLDWGDAQVYCRRVHGPGQLKGSVPWGHQKILLTDSFTPESSRHCPWYLGSMKEVDADVSPTQKELIGVPNKINVL